MQNNLAHTYTGGDLYNSKEKRAGNTTSEFIGSNLSAANDINIDTARAKIVGSTLLAANSIKARTDVGDITLTTAANNENSYKYEKEVSVGLGDVIKSLTRPDQAISSDNNRLTLKLADATYDEVDSKEGNTQNKSSVLQAGNNITLDAAGDISIKGSQLIANTSENELGDIALLANGDINIKEAKDKFNSVTKETRGKAELSVVVQHQAVEVANAIDDFKKAKKQLKKASEDYRQYKKDLAKQKTNLATLEAGYKNKDVGISYLDIQELRELIESAEDDKTWYEAGIAAATLNVTSKSTLLIQQTAAAAQSAVTWGFNAGVQLEIDASKTQNEQTQTASVASILQGRNITLMNKGDSLIQGSRLNAANDVNINTRNLSILASRDTAENSNKTERGNIIISQTVWGAAGGPTVNASFDRSRAQNSQTTYTNSSLNANNITLITKENATIRGGNVRAQNSLIADIGKNLTIESVQNRTQGKSNSFSISGGFGFGAETDKKNNKVINDGKSITTAVNNLGASNGKVSSVNAGLGASSGRYTTRQTVLSSLTAGNTADITVKEHTQLNGALLATVDEDNTDLGNLSLTTNSFGFEDLSNTTYNTNRNANISTSVSLGASKANSANNENTPVNKETKTKLNTSNMQYSNSTGYEKTKTLATLGKGNIQIAKGDSNNLDRLNRDTKNISKDLYNIERQQGNIDLTIDHRLFSEEGRNQIKEDYKRTAIMGAALIDMSKDGVSFFGIGEEQTSLREHLMNKQDYFTAVKTFSADKKNEKYIEVLTNGNAGVDEKQTAYTALANSVAVQLGIPLTQAKLLIQNDSQYNQDKGFYSKENQTIYVVDNNTTTTGDAVNTVGHEVAHHMDNSRNGNTAYTQTKVYKDNRDSYAEIMGEALEDYTSFAFAMNGYNSLTAINQKTGSRNASWQPVALIQKNNTVFSQLNPNAIEHRQFNKQEAGVLDRIRQEIQKETNLTTEQKKIKTHNALAIACAEVNCANGVSFDERNYKELKALQNLGEQLKKEGSTLAALTTTQINADLFNYNWLDRTNDFLSRHDEARIRTGGVIRSIAGGGGMFGGATLTAGGYLTCGVTFGTGCAIATVGGIPLTYLSYTEAKEGINQTFGIYKSPIGQQVIDSFSLKTHQNNLTPLQNMGVTTVVATGEIVLAKVGGKYIEKGIEKWKQSKINKNNTVQTANVVPDTLVADEVAALSRIKANAEASLNLNQRINAKAIQVDSGYNADIWKTGRLNEGDVIYSLSPNPNPKFFTSLETLQAGKFDSSAVSRALQIEEHPLRGYRVDITGYRVKQDFDLPYGTTRANPQFGPGGGDQYLIFDHKKYLEPITTIDMKW